MVWIRKSFLGFSSFVCVRIGAALYLLALLHIGSGMPIKASGLPLDPVVLDSDPLRLPGHPFYENSAAALGLAYSSFFGLSDAKLFSLGGDLSHRQWHVVAFADGYDIGDVYRNYAFTLCIASNLTGRVYGGVAGRQEVERFGGDDRLFMRSYGQAALGYRFALGVAPFVSWGAANDPAEWQIQAGLLADATRASKFAVALRHMPGEPVVFWMAQKLDLHQSLSCRWTLRTQPVRFSAGLSLELGKKTAVRFDYQTHPSLGGSTRTALLFRPWAD